MARLPTVSGDGGAWGTVLNDYLTQNIPSRYTLASSTNAQATTLTVDKAATGMLAGGSFVAIGAMTSKCEIRRVTGVSSATLTISTALVYGHSVGEFVWVLEDTWVTPEWFGCKANDASFDSSTGLMQASIDAALTSNTFGLTGRLARYYSSIPLWFPDGSILENIVLTVKAPFAVDPKIGLRNGKPDQFFVSAAGQFGTISAVNTTTNVITTSTSVGSAMGDRIAFYPAQGATIPAPLEVGRTYYLKTASGNDYTISIDRDGTALDLTSAGSGTTYWFSLGNTRIKWTRVTLEGNATQALNGLISQLQQPAHTVGLRIQDFPGPKGCWVLGGQQSEHFSTMIVDGSVGINFQTGQFHYFHGCNLEDCDILCLVADEGIDGGVASGRDMHFWGCHFESPGVQTARTQTIMGSAPVSAGTFTLSFGGQTTGTIAFDASAATIQTALEALSTIAPGDVTVTQEVGLLSDGGRMRIDFAGAYAWKVLLGTERTAVSSAGLTGGTYSMNYVYPEGRGISLLGPCVMLGVHGGVWSGGSVLPDGTMINSLTNESASPETYNGYIVSGLISMGQLGNAIKDNKRNITVPWADATGTSERLAWFSAGGWHGGSHAKNWYLAGRTGGHLAWEEYTEELRFMSTAKMRFGDTGPIVSSGTGTPESVVAAPVGSLFLRTDGGASTTLYVKQSGTSTTGWVAK